ncbi:hypothetical protein LOC54_09900 [Acetobacter sp. AN02]|uniref:glucosamine inositolphosphorylceramide transferase family protein n=1 Tax=Acetobacter sp. AN02 TaxID=2894186 RepID=UPI0024344646|nr:hypothetical protein [Acetobacter sp. AN02]MDG6095411.1 hypothetical protein [Acetobacter sp. AN02]
MSIFMTDIWRTGIVEASPGQILDAGTLDPFVVRWLSEERPLCFLADPFGLRQDGFLYLFAEYYDYRTKRGVIRLDVLDPEYRVVESGIVLSRPWHLSYPVVFRAEGEIWMLPEAYKSGSLTLYRAVSFPWRWEEVPEFRFPCAAIDASPLYADRAWWMFYTPPFPKEGRTDTLHIARAETLTGVWRDVCAGPVRRDRSGSRMGGLPFLSGGRVILPVQDCSATYGGGIRFLETALPVAGEVPEFRAGGLLRPPASAAPYVQGLHTLSGVCGEGGAGAPEGAWNGTGDVTLIDAKYIGRNWPRRLAADVRYRLGLFSG